MRGINLLPKTQVSNVTLVVWRRWALNGSIILMVLLTFSSVSVFLLDLLFKGNVRQVQARIVVKESEIRTLSGIESLQLAIKKRVSTIVALKKKQSNYKPTVDTMTTILGLDGTLSDLSLDDNKVSMSCTVPTSDGLVAIFSRLNTSAASKKLMNVALAGLSKDESGSWRLTLTAESL